MRNRWLTAIGVVLVALTLATADGGAQAGRAASSAAAAKASTAPRTPWGHPDLQGVWTTDSEIGVPVERPVDLGTKAVLTDEEFAERAHDAKEALRGQQGGIAVPRRGHRGWSRALVRGQQARVAANVLIIDPPNGRMPEYTAEAKTRVVPKGSELGFVGGSFGKGPYDGPEDLAPRPIGASRAGCRRPGSPASTTTASRSCSRPTTSRSLHERLHEARVIPLDGRPHLASNVRQWFGDSRGPVGGRDAGRRRDELRPDHVQKSGRRAAADRALSRASMRTR